MPLRQHAGSDGYVRPSDGGPLSDRLRSTVDEYCNPILSREDKDEQMASGLTDTPSSNVG